MKLFSYYPSLIINCIKTFGYAKMFFAVGTILFAAITKAQEVKLYTGCNIVLNGNINIVLNNVAFKNNGTFIPSISTFSFTGNADTNVANISGTSNTKFYNLTLNKSAYGLTIKSATSIINTITATDGIFYANGNLTLLSDTAITARVAQGSTAGGYINGNVTVERFIPQNANRGWRLLTSPTSGQTIKESWQEGQAAGANGNPGYGTIITSNSTSWLSDGFDFFTLGGSLLSYNQANDQLLPVVSTNALLSNEPGYFIYIRGNRSVTPSSGTNSVNHTILRSKGNLYTGNRPAIAVPSGKFGLIGNPYASAIDLKNVILTGGCSNTAFYIWDPKLLGSYNLGAYQTLTPSGGNFIIIPGGGSFGSNGSIVNTIQSGAAFFIEATGSAGTITINESSKTTGSSLVFRPGSNFSEANLICNLFTLNGSEKILADGNMVFFNEHYSNNIDGLDNTKMINFGENFSIMSKNSELAVERRNIPLSDTINFAIYNLKKKSYKLQLLADKLNTFNQSATLEDRYTHTNTPISLDDTTNYVFLVDNNAGSYIENRFRIIFNPIIVLPLVFTTVEARLLTDNVLVNWQAQDEINTIKYHVQKSTNGVTFTTANITLKNNLGRYSWTDSFAITGKNYYRVNGIDLNGRIRTSKIVSVLINKYSSQFIIQPNPVKGNLISLKADNPANGTYQFKITNSQGQLIFKAGKQIINSDKLLTIDINKNLPAGIYQLQIHNPLNKITVQQLIISK